MQKWVMQVEELYGLELGPIDQNGYAMFGASSTLAYLGNHAGKQRKQMASHLCEFEHV
jgi:hypothetical protein